MINIKQIRESYNLIVEKDDDMRKLTALARSGLFDVKKIPMLKRALQKDSGKLNPVERKLLLDLLDSLMDEVLHSQQVYNKVKQDVMRHDMHESEKEPKEDSWSKKIPFMIMLKRKSVRQFGSGQTVGLYYAQALDKYISIAFGEKSALVDVNEENLEEISQGTSEKVIKAYNAKIAADPKDELSRQKLARFVAHSRNTAGGSRTWAGKNAVKSAETLVKQGGVNASINDLRDKQKEQQKIEKKKNSVSSFTSQIHSAAGGDTGADIAAGVAGTVYGLGKLTIGAGKLVAKGIRKLAKPAAMAPAATPKLVKEESSVKSKFYKKIEENKRVEQEKLDEIAHVAPFLALGAGAARIAAPVVAKVVPKLKGWGRNLLTKAVNAKNKTVSALAGVGATSLLPGGGGEGSEKETVDSNKVTANRGFGLKSTPVAARAVTGQGIASLAQQNAQNKNFAARSEETVINQIREFVKSDSFNNIVVNENLIDINTNIAEKVLTVYESLNAKNKAKFEKMLSESKESFRKAVNFALGY